MIKNRQTGRVKRHKRIRLKVKGTKQCPRLCIFRSLNNIFTQIINDAEGKTLLALSSLDAEVKKKFKNGGNIEAAKAVGKLLAEKALKKNIKKIVFDRAGYAYHGRVKALAEEARQGGLEF